MEMGDGNDLKIGGNDLKSSCWMEMIYIPWWMEQMSAAICFISIHIYVNLLECIYDVP